MTSVVFVAGARPNFMKIAPILRAVSGRFVAELVHTGQHYDFDMSGVFFEQLGIPKPDVHLQIGSAGHGAQTGRIMVAFEEYLVAKSERPRGVVVVGDVNSTMACSLVAVKLGIPVAHVEAGLRSFDREMPEEINRLVTDTIADLLLVSEPAGLENLAREGIPSSRIHYTGNVMIDSLVEQLVAARALAIADQMKLRPREYALVTLHRPSNVDSPERLGELVDFIRNLSEQLPVVFPVHPRTAKQLDELGLRQRLGSDRVHLSTPLGYREFLSLMDTARVVVTDSGGIQEETTYLGVPCITLRATTERPVTISHGTNALVGDDLGKAETAIADILGGLYKKAQPIEGWDGRAAGRIVDVLTSSWS